MIVSQVNGTFCSFSHCSNTIILRRIGSLLCVSMVFSVHVSICSNIPTWYHWVGTLRATWIIRSAVDGALAVNVCQYNEPNATQALQVNVWGSGAWVLSSSDVSLAGAGVWVLSSSDVSLAGSV